MSLPLRGNQALNLSIFQSLKVCTFRCHLITSPPPPSLTFLLVLFFLMHTCKRLITVVTIFSFLHICQTDSVAALGHVLAEQSASSTPIETRVAPDGVGNTWAEFSFSLPIFVILFLSSPLSVSSHNYHATYTYLITFDKTNLDFWSWKLNSRDNV